MPRVVFDSPAKTQTIDPPGDLSPADTATKLLGWCRVKQGLRSDVLFVRGLMAGAFIGLGAIFYTATMIGVPLGNGAFRILGSGAFSMGLLLVCMTAAELSTGNCLIFAGWAEREVSLRSVGRLLAASFVANAIASVALAILMQGTGLLQGEHGRVAASIAEAKMLLPFGQVFVRGILCNALVCLAVWMILAARTLGGKFMGLLLPVTAFVAIGFEHSVANVYFLTAGFYASANGTFTAGAANIIAATLGNLIGGAGVAFALWWAHIRREHQSLPVIIPMKLPQYVRAGQRKL